MFAVGFLELAFILILFALAAALAPFRPAASRWALTAAMCALAASLFTPADPASTLIWTGLLFVFYVGGTRFARPVVV